MIVRQPGPQLEGKQRAAKQLLARYCCGLMGREDEALISSCCIFSCWAKKAFACNAIFLWCSFCRFDPGFENVAGDRESLPLGRPCSGNRSLVDQAGLKSAFQITAGITAA
jgi:hypothetical protein